MQQWTLTVLVCFIYSYFNCRTTFKHKVGGGWGGNQVIPERCQYLLNEMLWNLWRRAWRTDNKEAQCTVTDGARLPGSTAQNQLTFILAPTKSKPGYQRGYWACVLVITALKWASAEDRGKLSIAGFKRGKAKKVGLWQENAVRIPDINRGFQITTEKAEQ